MKELSKEEIRRMIWNLMLRKGIARFPLPPHGRIPNFAGAERAARKVFSLSEWKEAKVIKVNPDSPQKYVRLGALEQGKILIMPTPRIKRGFILLDPKRIPEKFYREAITIRGAFKWGALLSSLNQIRNMLKKIDLIVEGSVAVDLHGNRLGKGEGGELWHRDVVAVWNLLLRARLGDGSHAPSPVGHTLDGRGVPFSSTATHDPITLKKGLWARWKSLEATQTTLNSKE